ncbi:MAG: tyrosine--tRNA ligase [Pseudomonadota bacterium]|nr:tyrosine--tRNA ligase [Pseudomonadota bacterium]
MAKPKSELLQTLTSRGYLHQCTDLSGLDDLARRGSIVGYIGFDCTADSLHVGSLVPIMLLRHLQRTGHKPLVLLGGGTTKIGDPSGRDQSRKLLGDEEISKNMHSLRRVFERYLVFGDGPTDALIINNSEWLEELNYVDFLREYGRHFSINRMLGFDSVKLRLEREQPLSFLEFNYMIFQAYDFLELSKRYGCLLQLGGSDQWGNIINGVELARRVEGKTLYGVTSPLLETASGQKMGKTAAGAVWLNEERLSSYDYWQYWRNIEDADVGRFLALFTDIPLDEVARLAALQGAEINDAKKVLADKATELCHGREASGKAGSTAYATFDLGRTGGDLPTFEVAATALVKGLTLFQAYKDISGLASSNGEVRRLVGQGGARVNDVQISSIDHLITASDVNSEGLIKLSSGKKRHSLLRPV